MGGQVVAQSKGAVKRVLIILCTQLAARCTASATQPQLQAYVASSTFGYSTDVISDFGMKKSHIHERNNGVHSYTKNTYL